VCVCVCVWCVCVCVCVCVLTAERVLVLGSLAQMYAAVDANVKAGKCDEVCFRLSDIVMTDAEDYVGCDGFMNMRGMYRCSCIRTNVWLPR
jgi:hypothetical protein